MKYYLYKFLNDKHDGTRTNILVCDPLVFAQKVFHPKTMAFCGIVIEAENEEAAKALLEDPSAEGTIYSCDEPKPTVAAGQILPVLEKIYLTLIVINDAISNISVLAENASGLDKDIIYAHLKSSIISKLNGYQFRDSDKS